MKYKAFILSLGLLVYLAEFVVIPRMMGAEAPAMVKSDCCGRETKCTKPEKKCPASRDCCLNCPMCTPVDLPAAREARPLPVVRRVYPSFEPSYLYLYQASPWKPPNTV